jgi:hypothetical protein
LLIDYNDTEEARDAERRRSSVTGVSPGILGAEKDNKVHNEKVSNGTGI